MDKKPCKVREESAAVRVFTTYELLEQVLVELSMEEVISLRAVSKYWHDIVNGPSASVRLGRKLFHVAAPTTPFWTVTQRRSWSWKEVNVKKYAGEPSNAFNREVMPSKLNYMLFTRLSFGNATQKKW